MGCCGWARLRCLGVLIICVAEGRIIGELGGGIIEDAGSEKRAGLLGPFDILIIPIGEGGIIDS